MWSVSALVSRGSIWKLPREHHCCSTRLPERGSKALRLGRQIKSLQVRTQTNDPGPPGVSAEGRVKTRWQRGCYGVKIREIEIQLFNGRTGNLMNDYILCHIKK